MQKLRPALYIFTLLIIFSITWLFYTQTNLDFTLNTNFINLFTKSNRIIENRDDNENMKTKQPLLTTNLLVPEASGSGDYTRLIDLKNFQFLHSVECTSNGNYPSLLIAVHTAPGNVEKRQVIRETWGMQRSDMKLVFMMGVPQKQEEINIAAIEHEKYKDIVQGNFKDSYRNLTYKHVMLLKYTVYHCPKIKYLLKTDDDVFINMPTVISYINSYRTTKKKTSELLYCLPMFGSPAIREKSKWQVTYEEFPDEFYPPYCSGFAELFSSDTVERIYRGAQTSKFLWIDDAFVTGVAREAANILITPLPETLYLKHKELQTILRINNTYPEMTYPFLLGPANIPTQYIKQLWYIVTHRKKS